MSDSAALNLLLAAAKDAATRGVDYYALLDLDPSLSSTTADNNNSNNGEPLTRETVQRAWRKRSLRYHPDKAGANFDKEKWEEFGLARDILASDEARAAYDGARSAVVQKQRERELMNAKQRRFAEELERAEGRSRKAAEEDRERRAADEAERGRQAAQGRAYMDERKRKMAEAEERARERERMEDDAREDRIRELEERIAEKARRKVEKRARKKGRESGVAVVVGEDGDVDMLSEQQQQQQRPAAAAAAAAAAVPASRPKSMAEQKAAPIPAVDMQMSDDPVGFWDTQWPKTKARLLAAQRAKESRVKEAQAAA